MKDKKILWFDVETTGLDAVRRYINEQEGKDVFEYSVFGSPNQKIGNFTSQQKLARWSA